MSILVIADHLVAYCLAINCSGSIEKKPRIVRIKAIEFCEGKSQIFFIFKSELGACHFYEKLFFQLNSEIFNWIFYMKTEWDQMTDDEMKQ